MRIVPQDSPSLFDGKNCTCCRRWCLLDNYYADRSAPDGRQSRCKDCQKASARTYRLAHPEWAAAHAAEYSKTHKERITENRHQSRPLRKEQENERNRQYRRTHAYHYRPSEEFKIKRREYQRSYYQKYIQDPDRHRTKIAGLHRYKSRKRGNGGSYTSQEWEAVVQSFDRRCLKCGKQEPAIKLTVDHVVPLFRGGTNDISNLQPLCKPCNSSKGTKIIDYR